ncbi:MAG TPA: helix-turn-helix domain-containing protein, partial [Candidatus Saccharimonadales bacterium]|nr:helix-turn-helix domain-containing protein [Candidatus Saccharimonadales bacterium]
MNNTISVKEAAKILGVSIKTLHRWEEKGLLIPTRTTGNHRRYDKLTLEEFKKKPRPAISPADTAADSENNYNEDGELINLQLNQSAANSVPSLTAPKNNPDEVVSAYSTSLKEDSFSKEKVAPVPFETKQESSTNDDGWDFKFYTQFSKRMNFVLLGLGLLSLTGLVIGLNYFRNPNDLGNRAKASNGPGSNNTTTVNISTASQISKEELSKLTSLNGEIIFNVPSLFNQDVTIKANLLVSGTASISGKLTAPNILYSVLPGQNITVSGDPQNPTISANASGVQSLQGQTGTIALTAGSGIGIDGLTITNSGVTSLTAGSGISLSGSNGSVTISSTTQQNSGVTSLTGTANQINVSSSTGSVVLSTPQDIATSSSPTFGSLTLSNTLNIGSDTINDFSGNGLSVIA